MISNIFLAVGLVLVLIGIIGMLRLETHYARAMSSTLVDTAGYLFILLGIIFRWPLSFMTFKILIIMILMLIINPLFMHFLLQSAWKSGHKEDVKKGETDGTGTDVNG